MSTRTSDDHPTATSVVGGRGHDLDVERDSDVPISTQIYWQLAFQIDSGRLQPGSGGGAELRDGHGGRAQRDPDALERADRDDLDRDVHPAGLPVTIAP